MGNSTALTSDEVKRTKLAHKRYIRTSACFKLLKKNLIDYEEAIEIMEKIGVSKARLTVELWRSGKYLKEARAENLLIDMR